MIDLPIKEKIKGALLGAAVGDALGVLVNFRIGQLKGVNIVSQQFTGNDSATILARALYNDGSSKEFNQILVKEAGLWKLGLKYGHDIK